MKRLATLITLLCLLTANAFAQDRQFLYIKFAPEDATLEINGEIKYTENGVYQELVPFGKYRYKVYKEGYTSISDVVHVSNLENTHRIDIRLIKPVGSISIPNTYNLTGAKVYVDFVEVGELPIKDLQLSKGRHMLVIKHPLYRVYGDIFQISNEEHKILTPELFQTHRQLELETITGAHIYVNGIHKGIETYNGKFNIGRKYRFDITKKGHKPTSMKYYVSHNDNATNVILKDPIPKYGTLEVNSTLPKASIYVDDKLTYNVTPSKLATIIGKHTVYVEYNDFKSQPQTVKIRKGKTSSLYFELPHGSLAITSTPPDGKVYLDDEAIGLTPKYLSAISTGNHKIRVEYDGHKYESQTKTISVIDGEYQELIFEKKCGTLMLTSNPSNATVIIDGQVIGNTPMLIDDIWEGEHTVTLKYDENYKNKTITKDITITEGDTTSLNMGIFGSLNVNSTPLGAAVYIDGNRVGNTPLYIPELIIDEHEVTVEYDKLWSKTKKISETKKVYIKEDTHEELSFDIEDSYQVINIKTNPEISAVYIDGEAIGTTPGAFIIPSGDHVISFKYNDNDFIYAKTINFADLKDNGQDEMFFDLAYDHDLLISVIEEEVEEDAIPFQLVEEKPSFLGGDANQFAKWVNQRLVYPEIAKENGVQGRVTLQFTVEKDGRITNVKVLRGVDPSLDKEAVRVVSSSPKWTPGKQRDRAVPVTYTFPVIFQLR